MRQEAKEGFDSEADSGKLKAEFPLPLSNEADG